ncbi:MAG: aspartate-semialdehyde dehydrogenase, partial [Planctomycetota bacterium]
MTEGSSRGRIVAVIGATGAVGREVLERLHRRGFPVRELRAIASQRSAG